MIKLSRRFFFNSSFAASSLALLAAWSPQCSQVCAGGSMTGECIDVAAVSKPNLATTRWSNGASGDNSISSIRVAAGRQMTVCTNPGFAGSCNTYLGEMIVTLPAGFNDTISSFEAVDAPGPIWSSWTYRATYPNARENCYSEEAQGIAHSDDAWYITSRRDVRRIALTQSLQSCPADMLQVHMPSSDCDHVGDAEFHQGRLYVPLEGCTSGSKDQLWVLDENLAVIARANMPAQQHFSWAAVHPATGMLFGAELYDGVAVLSVYDVSQLPAYPAIGTLQPAYHVLLGMTLRNVQGGAFAPDGTLYLTSDDTTTTSNAGIYAFRIRGAVAQRVGTMIGPNGYAPGGVHPQEIEGLTYLDVAGLGVPNVPAGQLHWVLLSNEWSDTDDVYIKHVSLNP